ncbi:MAG TPA: MarR family transcriptional regulator [Solirubrobacter sp.]|nr:MarR family transcriptional regulator [Solirubrobacter sp.]
MNETQQRSRPVRGPLFEQAVRLAPRVGDARRLKVLALIAAHADAGCPNPTIGELAMRLGERRVTVVRLIDRLEADGLLAVHRSGASRRSRVTRYELRLEGGGRR